MKMNSCVEIVFGTKGRNEEDIEAKNFIENIKSSSEGKGLIKKVGFLNDVSSLSPRKSPHLFINTILLVGGIIFI